MHTSRVVLLEMLAMVHGRKAKVKTKEKALAQKCLHCEQDAVPGYRGLCKYHYSQFDNDREIHAKAVGRGNAKKIADAKKAFDDKQVEAGNILPARRGRRPRTDSPFRTVA